MRFIELNQKELLAIFNSNIARNSDALYPLSPVLYEQDLRDITLAACQGVVTLLEYMELSESQARKRKA